MVTSNRGPDEWLVTFADPIRAQSAIDRFTSNAYDLGDRRRVVPQSAQADAGEGAPAGVNGRGNGATLETTQNGFLSGLDISLENARFPHFHRRSSSSHENQRSPT
jgi:hypothetical protein